MVKHRFPKPQFEVRVLVGPPTNATHVSRQNNAFLALHRADGTETRTYLFLSFLIGYNLLVNYNILFTNIS